MSGTARIIRADSRHLPLADDSVDLVVTSPPYFALRSYTDNGVHYARQIGAEATPDEFVTSLLEVTAECVRVLKPSGSLWVNLGDKYSGAQAQNIGGANRAGDSARTWAQTDPKRTGIPNKSLCGIPWRYALRCIDDLGLILRAEVIWSKPNGMPESVTDRVRRSHEQWFHFTLSPRYFSAVDEIREPHTGNAHSSGNGQSRQWIASNDGQRHRSLDTDPTEYNPLGKLPGSVWTIPTEPLNVPDHLGVDHFAAFPTEWPRRIIAGWSPSGVCTACGEGLRPVAEVLSTGGPVARAHRHLPGYADPAGVGRRDVTYRIEGYECTCRHWTQQDIASARTTAPTTNSTEVLSAAAADSPPLATPAATAKRDAPCGSSVANAADRCSGPELGTGGTALKPAVVLDPFGGTGTTALVAKALGRQGISVDMSADYCRLARWRVNDPNEIAKAMRVDKPAKQVDGQGSLLDPFGEGIA